MSISIRPMPGRISTFRVLTGDPQEPGLIGFIRLDDTSTIRWVARTVGTADAAADIQSFCDRDKATAWLEGKAESPIPTRRRSA